MNLQDIELYAARLVLQHALDGHPDNPDPSTWKTKRFVPAIEWVSWYRGGVAVLQQRPQNMAPCWVDVGGEEPWLCLWYSSQDCFRDMGGSSVDTNLIRRYFPLPSPPP